MLNTLSLHPPHNKRTNDDTNSDVKMKKSTFKVLWESKSDEKTQYKLIVKRLNTDE